MQNVLQFSGFLFFRREKIMLAYYKKNENHELQKLYSTLFQAELRVVNLTCTSWVYALYLTLCQGTVP